MLKAGDQAPDFELPADSGEILRLSDFRGRKVVLFFYPKADTPGCTTEACEFRDHHENFEAGGAVILGISPDSVEDVRKFREKYYLPYPLLADSDHKVAEEYGVWQEKSMYGRRYWGVVRTTFVIDEEGVVARVYERVSPRGHASSVLSEL